MGAMKPASDGRVAPQRLVFVVFVGNMGVFWWEIQVSGPGGKFLNERSMLGN